MKSFVIGICLLTSLPFYAQEIPEWYQDLVEHKIGEWVVDNAAYSSDNEPTEHYTMHWWKGINGQDLHGVLKTDDEDIVWTFYQYYDPIKQKAVVMQFGLNGLNGTGELLMEGDTLILEQQFKAINGSKWKERHRTTVSDKNNEKTISYTYDETGTLKEGRTYTWEKSEYIKL